MHDQKLTEGEHYRNWWEAEFERVRDELDYFTRHYAFVRRGVEDNTRDTNVILGQRGRNKQADQLFRRGMVGAAQRMVMEDVFGKNYILPTIMRPEYQKPIDHPYLLPPASGQVYWLTGSGRTEQYSDGSTVHMVFGPWDSENGAIPSQIVPQPPIKVSGPYIIHMHTADLFPQKVRCAFGASYYDKEKTKRAPCYLCGRIHD